MKKVLIVIEKFYPTTTAITNCLEPIFAEMKNQKISIDVITYRQDKNLKKSENINGINIYRVNDYYNMIKSTILKQTFFRILRKLFLKKNFIKTGKSLLKKQKYDCVIACSYPFLMEEMACEIVKNTSVPFVSYQFDPNYNNHLLDLKSKNERLKKELQVLNESSCVFLPKENYEENIKCELVKLKNKYYPIDFPLIKEWKKYPKQQEENAINFVYAGTFYKDIREPDEMLNFFEKLNLNYKLYIYCIASEEIKLKLEKYKEILKDKIVIKYNQNKEVCNKALYNANFIINIGNTISNQTPSKIYEYISLGKPIINFYSIDADSSKKVLSKYDLCINIKTPLSKKDINLVEKFCNTNINKKYEFNQIKKIYKSSEDVSKEFIEKLGEVCEKQ